jgi:phosphoserine phosphatase RsbU/P
VATADLSLFWLENMMNYIKVYETGYVFLVSEKGTVITHPVKEFQMQNIENLAKEKGSQEWINIVNQLKTSKEGYMPFHSLVDGRPCWLYFSTLPQTQWRMAVVFPEEELFAGLHSLFLNTVFMGFLGILLISLIVIGFSAQIIKPLSRLTQTADLIGGGNFNIRIPEDRSTREINLLGNAFNRMQDELKDFTENLANTTAIKERFESELNIAHDIQQGMIPKLFPPFPDREDVDIYALLVPARQVGGDFYDFFFLDEETLCFAIGDVSDKGVPASLMMSMTITLFRAKADMNHSIHELVEMLNRDISKDNVNLMFITFFLGILNLRTGEMQYCNAGHNYPLLIRNSGEIEELSETHGLPLGIKEKQVFSSAGLKLEKGETLILYTDGITEALSIDGTFYSDERLSSLVSSSCRNKSTREVTDIIMNDVAAFVRTDERSDDITLLVLSYYPEEIK